MKTSPTSRTLALLRGLGLRVAVTEHWNPFARIRQDLFGFADLVAFSPAGGSVALVQTTSSSNLSSRASKILDSDLAREWYAPGRAVLLVGWAKRGDRGKRKLWTPSSSVLRRDSAGAFFFEVLASPNLIPSVLDVPPWNLTPPLPPAVDPKTGTVYVPAPPGYAPPGGFLSAAVKSSKKTAHSYVRLDDLAVALAKAEDLGRRISAGDDPRRHLLPDAPSDPASSLVP